MWKHKPTRTDDNKPSQSSPFRKWSMSKEQIKQEALKISWLSTSEDGLVRKDEPIEEVQAPAIEPLTVSETWTYRVSCNIQVTKPIKWDYEVYAEKVKKHCIEYDTYTVSVDELKKYFPQNKDVSDIVRNLKRGHWISYRRLDNWNYLLFVEPTKEELIVQLTSAESKVIELESQKISQKSLYEEQMNRLNEEKRKLHKVNDDFIRQIWEENESLRKEIKRQSFWINTTAILSVLTIGWLILAHYYWK